jgi:hypothetical protein
MDLTLLILNRKRNRWVSLGLRGTCQLGVLPCNGLLYMPPHACNCESERKMLGYFALAPALSRTYPDPQQFQPRFYQGPAFDHRRRSGIHRISTRMANIPS